MSSQRYPPEFKDEAVRQVLERGYTVAEASQRQKEQPERAQFDTEEVFRMVTA